jgi:hypothetical protein
MNAPEERNTLCDKDELFSMNTRSFNHMRSMEGYWRHKQKQTHEKYSSECDKYQYFRQIPFIIFVSLKTLYYWNDMGITHLVISPHMQLCLAFEKIYVNWEARNLSTVLDNMENIYKMENEKRDRFQGLKIISRHPIRVLKSITIIIGKVTFMKTKNK